MDWEEDRLGLKKQSFAFCKKFRVNRIALCIANKLSSWFKFFYISQYSLYIYLELRTSCSILQVGWWAQLLPWSSPSWFFFPKFVFNSCVNLDRSIVNIDMDGCTYKMSLFLVYLEIEKYFNGNIFLKLFWKHFSWQPIIATVKERIWGLNMGVSSETSRLSSSVSSNLI